MTSDIMYKIYATRLKTYAITSLAAMLMTALIGGLVKAYNAGMACGPDWPHCNGALLPLDTISSLPVFLEYIHRVIGGLSYILAIAVAVTAFKLGDPRIKIASIIVLASLTVQVILGMMVVRTFLDSFVVAFHLSFALLSITLMTFIASAAYFKIDNNGCR